MKRFLVLLALFVPILGSAQFKAPSFTTPPTNSNDVYEGVDITGDTIISLNYSQAISSFAISGSANLIDDTSFIRVILRNTYNADYLVYENYSLLSDSMYTQFSRTGMESIALNKIVPQSIVIHVKNASLSLDSIHFARATETEMQFTRRSVAAQNDQASYLVNRLNEHLRSNNKTWRAGHSVLSEKTYEEKKSMFGGIVPDFYGYDYYIGGIYELPDNQTELQSTKSSVVDRYVKEWDWRKRHGKNWMTPVKNQRYCGSCWAFAALGAVEPYINLYYNRLLNMDLSEQELLDCCPNFGCGFDGSTLSGGSSEYALMYIAKNGITTEEGFPYQGRETSCDLKSDTTEIIKIESYSNRSLGILMKEILFRSPITLDVTSWRHAVAVAGYKTMLPGDTVYTSLTDTIVLDSTNILVGKTAWLIKNSWGTNLYGDEGYGYVVVNGNTTTHIITGNIESSRLDNSDILITDDDGDGYYFWGIGPKPSSCPTWIPDEADGDDSDYSKGPIDTYGFTKDLDPNHNDTIIVEHDTCYTGKRFLYNHSIVRNGATLTITGDVNFYKGVRLTIDADCELIVDGCTIEDAEIEVNPRGKVTILNNGSIKLCKYKSFYIPLGSELQIDRGVIKQTE